MTARYPTPRRFTMGIFLALLALTAGCGDGILGSREDESIPRETFLATMVELRIAAYRATNDGILPAGAHEEILTRNGVTTDEMVNFVEVHGRDIPFMDSVWADVDGHIRAALEARVVESTPTSP